MDASAKNSPCKDCRDGDDDVSLYAEVEHLRQHLTERDSHIVAVEAEFIKCTARAGDLEEQVTTWREKYERLYDSHKRVQKLNQVLEDKLLQMVDKMKGEKSQLTKDIATLSVRLAEAKHNCSMLQKENERYKNDMNLAIQLLQCKPDNFVAQKLDNLPVDTQARVSQYVMSKTTKAPGSAQSVNGKEADTFDTSEYEFNISASLMTKILEDSIQDTVSKHCDTCTCNKSQNKPFCYNESNYTVATQTQLSGEMKNSLCLSCNTDIKSIHSNISVRSSSPGIKLINDKSGSHIAPGSMYIIPQEHSIIANKEIKGNIIEKKYLNELSIIKDSMNSDSNTKKTHAVQSEIVIEQYDIKHTKKSVPMEPTVHHKLCDRTKTSISSKKSSVHLGEEELLMKDNLSCKESKLKCDSFLDDHVSVRKNSQSSMGAVSRTSMKSSASANKSNTQVGPGPRFCHLRMQAGSKNILLDNAQPDVPPVLYKRQSKCNDELIFRDDSMDNFQDINAKQEMTKTDNVSNVVVESTLIDVHVDNSNKEKNVTTENTSINPVLLNVSSSPLQPLKTHNFSNSIESNNNNKSLTIENQQNILDNDNLLKDLNVDFNNVQNNNVAPISDGLEKPDILTPTDNHDVKIFNFDRYEKSKQASQYNKYLRKIDMSQFHSIENTRISKDFSPQNDLLNQEKKIEATPKSLPPIVNVYPNLTQTHLKANEKKVSTNDQSTSSLSSDDSAAILQKQQLLRVAEWVEKNLEQQNSFKDPLDDEINFNNRASKRDSRLSRLNETLHEIALNMPHPVSKYSKPFSRELQNTWVHAVSNHTNEDKTVKTEIHPAKFSGNIAKETIFPVEECAESTNINNDNIKNGTTTKEYEVSKALLEESFRSDKDRAITADELARMEYNVKKFLLSGPHWATPDVVGRSRRTSSKTETDV